MTHYLQPVIEKEEAVQKMSGQIHTGLWKKLRKTKQLTSMEQVYIPFYCFDYKAVTHSLPDGLEGRMAIEPLSRMSAILPVDLPLEESSRGFWPVQGEVSKQEAREVLYWEMFSKEKRREKIQVEIVNRFVVYVPYWLGYIKDGKGYDVLALDGLNGKVDVPIKDTVLSYVCGHDEVNMG